MLSSGTVALLRLAALVQAAIVGVLGLPDRGVKTRQPDDRGGASLHSGRAPAILIEPYFASNERDLEVTRDPEAMAAQARAANELEDLASESALGRMMVDYGVNRAEIRACRGDER